MTPRVHNLVCVVCNESFQWQYGNPKKGRKPQRCPDCRESDPRGRELEKLRVDEKLQMSRITSRFSEFDKSELQYIIDKMATTQIDALRTAVRVYATLLRRS